MKKTYLILPATILAAGCAAINSGSSPINDPNIPIYLDAVGVVGTAIAGPVGSMLLVGATTLSTLWGVWQKNRTKKSETKFNTLQNVTATVVQTIDEISSFTLSDNTTLGDTVKAKVKENLASNDMYQVGKAIISGLKTETAQAIEK